ncbi:hypothetical protein LCGC14_1504300, partial [marine sediment metagenome]
MTQAKFFMKWKTRLRVLQYVEFESDLNDLISEKCREQREADGNPKGKDTFTKNYPAKGSFIVYLNHADVLNTPLVTTKTDDRPKCDECGKPLLDS